MTFGSSSGNVLGVNYNDATYYYYYNIRNTQNDVVGFIDKYFNTVVKYTYDSWGKLLSTICSLASTLGVDQPFRYCGYVYDTETGWYYLQSRYYDPTTCRFISADVYLSTGQEVLGHNAYACCRNNSIVRIDIEDRFWDTVFDVISFCASVAEVIANLGDLWAWAGLAGDALDLIPGVTGVGEVTRTVKIAVKAVDKTDNVVDAVKTLCRAADNSRLITKSTGLHEIIYESGKNMLARAVLNVQ